MESLFLTALNNQPTPRPPVWLMRQAGRYLSEYREIKSRHSFLEMCRSPELALEISLQPIRILDPDAAIVFADILLPAEALGFQIEFNPGPKVKNAIKHPSDIKNLLKQDPRVINRYVMQTISLLKTQLAPKAKAVLGFAGAPWTMACYLIDQGSLKHFQGTQVFAEENESAFRVFMQLLTELTSDYLLAQVESGADAVQLFDSWAGNLSLEDYKRWALPYTAAVIERVRDAGGRVILYVNGSAHLLPAMIEAGANCLSVDWRTPLENAQEMFGERGSIQGNFDPTHLFGSAEKVVKETENMLSLVNRRGGYIANLGHGILQTTPRENVIAFVNTVKAGWPK